MNFESICNHCGHYRKEHDVTGQCPSLSKSKTIKIEPPKGEGKTMKKQSKKNIKFWADHRLADAQREELNAQPDAISHCPFCREVHGEYGPEVMRTHPGTDWVECNNCGAQGPGQTGRIRAKGAAARAVKAWNSWGDL